MVAILDYMSQTVLRPAHNFMFRILRSVPQDYTFNQDGFRDRIKWGEGVIYHSVDLSRATDRFPFSLTLSAVEPVFGKEWATHFRRILVGFPFKLPKSGPSSVQEEAVYAVGSSMGALGSFAFFAFGHHYLVFWCCEELGISWEEAEYALLGDDVAFWNPALAELYKKTLLDLGVEVSPGKTIVSTTTVEFANRVLFHNEEVSAFPISAISDRLGDIGLLAAALLGERKKGFIPSSGIPAAIVRLLVCTNQIKVETASKLSQLITRLIFASDFLRGKLDAVSAVLGICRIPLDDPVRESWTEERARTLLLSGMASLYVRSVQAGQLEDVKQILRMVQADGRCDQVLWPQIVSAVPLFAILRKGEEGMIRVEEDITCI